MEILQFARFVVRIASVMAPLAISILVCKRRRKKGKATKKTKAPSECHVNTTSVAVREDKKCKSVQQPNTSKLAKNTGSIGCVKVERQEPRKEDSVKVSDNEQAENLTEYTSDGNNIQASRKITEMAANDENVKEVEEHDSFKKGIVSNYFNEGHKDLLKNQSLNEVDRGQQREIISVEAKELCVATTENTPKKNDVENKSSVTCSFKDDDSWKIWAATTLDDSSAISDVASPIDSAVLPEPAASMDSITTEVDASAFILEEITLPDFERRI